MFLYPKFTQQGLKVYRWFKQLMKFGVNEWFSIRPSDCFVPYIR